MNIPSTSWPLGRGNPMFLYAYQQGNPYRHAPCGPLAADDGSASVGAQTVVRPTVVLGQRDIFTRDQRMAKMITYD